MRQSSDYFRVCIIALLMVVTTGLMSCDPTAEKER